MRKARFFAVLIALSLAASTTVTAQKNPMRILTGRVLGGQDAPVAKAVVYLKNTKSLTVKTYISDADGSFRFPALSENVDYEVYAEYEGAHSDTKTLSAFDSRKQITMTLHIHSRK